MSQADEDRVVSLLRADVEATIGPAHHQVIVRAAARRRLYVRNPAAYAGEVVADVQQHFHDLFVDTAWPACPEHPNHPLWFSDGWWRCEQLARPVAELGALSSAAERT